MAPPPPICFPFIGKKPKRRLSWSPSDRSGASFQQDQVIRHPSFSPTSTLTTQADNLTFHSDSEKYDDVPAHLPEIQLTSKGKPRLTRSNTMTGTKKSTASNKWGYGWGIGKQKEKGKEEDSEREMSEKPESMTSQTNLPLYQPPIRSNSKSTQASRSTQNTSISSTASNFESLSLTRRAKRIRINGTITTVNISSLLMMNRCQFFGTIRVLSTLHYINFRP